MKKGVVYCITCKLCNNKYVGETNISARDRLSEYSRFANNPNCNSYKEEALTLTSAERPITEHRILHSLSDWQAQMNNYQIKFSW